jgi:hypothetical protein
MINFQDGGVREGKEACVLQPLGFQAADVNNLNDFLISA